MENFPTWIKFSITLPFCLTTTKNINFLQGCLEYKWSKKSVRILHCGAIDITLNCTRGQGFCQNAIWWYFEKNKYGLKEKSFKKYYRISHCMPNLWALPISLYRSDNGVYKTFLNQIGYIFPYFCSCLVCLFNLCLMELIGLVWIFLLTFFNVIDILQYFVSLILLPTMLFTAS